MWDLFKTIFSIFWWIKNWGLHLQWLCNDMWTILESYFIIILHRCPLTSVRTPPYNNKRSWKSVIEIVSPCPNNTMTVLCASLKQQYHHRMVTENTILLVFLTLLLKELNTMQQTAFFFCNFWIFYYKLQQLLVLCNWRLQFMLNLSST